MTNSTVRPRRNIRRRSILRLAKKCDWHQTHSEHVTALCLMFFDQLESLHHLGTVERELIEYASLLHDIGWSISGKRHHKHSMELIKGAKLSVFSAEEIGIIANVARYHRKALPKKKHSDFFSLSETARHVVELGASLLRVADGLDRTHESSVRGMICRVGKSKVRCTLRVRGDVTAEIDAAARKSDLFQRTFGRAFVFDTTEV